MTASQDHILAVNAGSSSLKLAIFKISKDSSEGHIQLYKASLSGLSTDKPSFTFSSTSSSNSGADRSDDITPTEGETHEAAFSHFLKHLKDIRLEIQTIKAIAHRVVHGGSMESPTIITQDTLHRLEELSDLAPLHNGPALTVIKTCIEQLPGSSSYALFDTSFHRSIPPHIYSYAIDPSIAKSKGLRKYGFHGLSYSYILRAISSHLDLPAQSQNFILLHLGSGASICAVKGGKSFDTTMGLTPLDGLPGSSRSGSVDPSLIFHYTSEAGKISHSSTGKMHLTEAEEILNKGSGWKALTGSSDFSTIPPSSLAYSLFLDRILSYLGSYFLKLGGSSSISALVFSGGIGENSSVLRKSIIDASFGVGVAPIDEEANSSSSPKDIKKVFQISREGASGVPSFVCFTDEQSEMAGILFKSGTLIY